MSRLGGVTRGIAVALAAVSAIAAVGVSTGTSSGAAAVPATTQLCSGSTSTPLYGDTFPQANGAPWASAWATGGNATVQGNGGQLSTTAAPYPERASAVLSGVRASADVGVSFSYRWANNTPGHYLNVFLGGNGYLNLFRPASQGIELSANSRAMTVMDHRTTPSNPIPGTLDTIPSTQVVSTAKQWVRMNVVGSTLQVRLWQDGQSEPTTWHTYTLEQAPVPGSLYLTLNNGANATTAESVTIDDLSYVTPSAVPCPTTTTTTTTAPPTTTTTIPPRDRQVVPFSDTFTRPDGSAWASAWTTDVANGSATTQGNAGQLSIDGTNGSFARTQLASNDASLGLGVVFSYRWSSTSTSAYLNVTLGSNGWQNSWRPLNGYGVELASNRPGALVLENNNGVTTQGTTFSPAVAPTTAKQWVRFNVVGARVFFRTWSDGQAEPTTWQLWDDVAGSPSPVWQPKQLYVSLNPGTDNVGAKSVTIDDVSYDNFNG